MSHDVFISYSSLDKPAADAVCHGLEAKGIRCWIAPRDQVAGQPFGQQITAAISAAQVMVLVFSDNVNKSHAVHNEVGIAANANVTIVPFRIASVDFNSELNFYLGRMHWLDAFPQPVDSYIDSLAATVRRNLTSGADVPQAAAASPPPPLAPPLAAAPPAAAPHAPAPPVPPRKGLGFWGWVGIVFVALVVLVIVDHLTRRPIPAITVKGDDGTTVTIGPGGASVVDANALVAPSAPPKPGSPPDLSAVRYYETVIVPGGPPSDIEDASVIGTAKLQQHLQDRAAGKRAFIAIDTRGCTARLSIPGSFCLSPTSLKELQAKVPDKDAGLVIFCDDGRCASAYALAQQAVAAGYEDVDWYRGGVNAWVSSGGPLQPLTPAAK